MKKIEIEAKDVSYVTFYPDDDRYNEMKHLPHAVVMEEEYGEYIVLYTIPESKVSKLVEEYNKKDK